jgi:hypothetical protein
MIKTKSRFAKGLSVLLSVLMIFVTLPTGTLKVQAAEGNKTTLYIDDGDISISGDTATYSGGMYKVTNTNGFIITQYNSTTSTFYMISVTEGNADITLQNVNIDEYKNGTHYYRPALSIANGASAKLTLSGSNILKGDNSCAGIFVPSGAELTINGNGSLTAIGGENGAGIGGSNSVEYGKGDTSGDACGTVNIEGGTVTATGNGGGAGIGGGKSWGDAGTTVITGGSVRAVGGVRGIVQDASGHKEHCVTVDANSIIGASKNLSVSVQGSSFSSTHTDKNGKLYFWMNENAEDSAIVQYGSNFYRLSVPVGTADTTATLSAAGKMGMLDLSQESISISSTSITAKDSNNQDAKLNANGYVIIQSAGGSTSNTISITGGTQQIMLQNVDIESSSGSAFSISSGASVNLSLSGTNTLNSESGDGIEVPLGASLNIVGGDSLTAKGSNNNVGIGCYQDCGKVTIDGGTVTTRGGNNGSGIGGVQYRSTGIALCSITINGGSVTSYGGYGSLAAIFGSIVINGGAVTAIGSAMNGNTVGNGIGGFYASVTINGGTVTARGGGGGAGIGGIDCPVTINGGTVDAYGGNNGAGIGSSYFQRDYAINITGGTVTAHGGAANAAGIGSGSGCCAWSNETSTGTVNISGGFVKAYSGQQSAGIGGSLNISGGTVNISGGTVEAYGDRTPGISGGNYYTNIAVTITGGSVKSSIQGTPTNGKDSVYLTNISAPSGTDVSNLSVKQSGSAYTYGFNDMRTDNSTYGKLYLWLPADTKTTADITTDGGSYSGYYGTVGTGNNSVLKMDQNALTIGGITDKGTYSYGSVPAVTVSGGSGTGNMTYAYTGTTTSGTVYNSSSEPSDAGTYSFTAAKAEDDCYYAKAVSSNFTITPKSLTDSDIAVIIPVQVYTGKPAISDVTVTWNGKTLVKGQDYTVSCSDSSLGAATATITGVGNYTGSVNKNFTIKSAPTISVDGDIADWRSSVPFTITATAGSSGLKSVTVKQNTGEPIPLSVSSDGNYHYTATASGTYTFTAASNSGLTVSKAVQADKIDAETPTIFVSGNPTFPVQSAKLAITATAGASGIKSVTVLKDSGQAQDITSSYQDGYMVSANGSYVFTVTNNAGVSVSSTPVVVTQIDTAKPVVSIDSNGYQSGTWTNKDVKLDIFNTTANLGTTDYEYSMNNGATWTSFDGSLTDSAEGVTDYSFRAISESGVVSDIQSITVKLDKSAPADMAIGFEQNPFKTVAHFATFGLFFGNTVNVNFSANDTDGSGTDYYEYQSVAQGGTFNSSGTWQTGYLSIQPNFKGTIYARAVDKAGNVSETVSKSLVVDKTAPVITANSGNPTLNTLDESASIPVEIKDGGAGVGTVTYQVNGDLAKTVDLTTNDNSDLAKNYSFLISDLPDGIYDVFVSAQDNAGNTAVAATVHVTKNAAQTGFGFDSDELCKTYGDTPFTIATTGGQSGGAVTYAVTSGADVVSVDAATGDVTIKKAGIAVITATKAAGNGYIASAAALTVNVSKSMPEVQSLPGASGIQVIGKLSFSNLTGGKASVPGTFKWSNPDMVVTQSGSYEVVFTPTDTENYSFCICMVDVSVSPILANSRSQVSPDLTGVTLPAGVTSVSLGVNEQGSGNSTYSVVKKLIRQNKNLGNLSKLTVYDLKLLDQSGNPIKNFAGNIKVKIPIPASMSGNLKVFYYNPVNGTLTDMNAARENGYLVFETGHFSYYAIAQLSSVSSSTSSPVQNPKTGSGNWPLIPLVVLGGNAAIGAVIVKRKRFFRRKKQA